MVVDNTGPETSGQAGIAISCCQTHTYKYAYTHMDNASYNASHLGGEIEDICVSSGWRDRKSVSAQCLRNGTPIRMSCHI